VHIHEKEIVVRFQKRAHNPLLAIHDPDGKISVESLLEREYT
jgi:hypothetical protein